MNTNNGKESYSIGLDTAQLMADAKKAENAFKSISDKAVSEGQRIDNTFRNIGAGIAGYFTVGAIKDFTKQIINARGQIESFQISFRTLIGDTNKADAFFSELKDFAVQTPLLLNDLAKGGQLLLGFGVDLEKVMPIMKSIGDVSMGNADRFNSLTLAFAQMSATGKLMGQDLLQMINAGFNPLTTMAETTGKSVATLKDEMSKGAISADMVTKAFQDATSEGGKFYGMLEKQSKGIQGSISNLEGAIQDALNEIGTNGQEIITEGISLATTAVQNYEKLGKVLVSMIATYGMYKTAVILATEAEKGYTLAQTLNYKALLLAEKAQMMLNAAMLANPYVLAAVALGAVVTAAWAFHDSAAAATKAQEKHNKSLEEAAQKAEEERDRVQKLIEVARDETQERGKRLAAMMHLSEKYPEIFGKYDIEKLKLAEILDLMKQVNAEIEKKAGLDREKDIAGLESEIKKYEELSRAVSGANGGYVEKLKQLRAERDLLLKDRGAKTSETYLGTLDKVDEGSLEHYVEVLKKKVGSLSDDKELKIKLPIDVEGNLSDEAVYTVSEIKSLISATESELNKKRNPEKKKTYGEEYRSAEKEWKEAKAALKKISEDKDKYTAEEYEKAKKREETAEKAFKNVGGKTDKQITAEENKAEQLRKKTESYIRLMDTTALQEARAAEDMQNQVDQANIDAMKDGAEKTRAQLELDFEKEMQLIDRQKEDALRTKIENARAIWDANPANKGKSFDATGIELTDEESQQFNNLYKATIDKNLRLLEDQNKAEREAMQNYLAEYGTYMQKRQAITEQYQQKIADATTEGDKKILQKQMEEALSNLDMENLKASINWEGLFGNLSKLTNKELKKLKETLDNFKKSNEFELMTPENKKVILDAYNNLSDQMNANGGIFGGLVSATKDYNIALQELTDAQKKYDEALASGIEEEIEKAKTKLAQAQTNVVNTRTKKTDATDATTKKLTTLSGVIADLGNASELSIASLGSLVETTLSAFSDAAGEVGTIIKAALDILDSIGNQDVGEWAKDIISKVFTAVGNILDSDYSPLHYLESSLLGSSDNSLEKDIETLSASNEALKQSMERLANIMEESAVADATSLYEEQLKYLNESISNTQEMMQRSAAAYSNGVWGIGGKHSSNYNIDKAMSASEWSRISKIVGKSVTSAGDFFSLSSEQMSLVADKAADLYNKIKQYADDGYEDAAQYMDEYIAYQEQLEELQDSLNAKLTSTDFDSVRDEFKSTLLDMESSTEDFAEAFEDMMQEAIIESLMSSKYDALIKEWYNEFASVMEDGLMSTSEQDRLRESYNAIVEQAVAERDALIDAMGWETDSSRTASSSSGITASQESVDKIDGIVTNIQGHTYSISESMKDLVSISAQALEKLANIDDNTRNLCEKADTIVEQNESIKRDISSMNTKGVTIKM